VGGLAISNFQRFAGMAITLFEATFESRETSLANARTRKFLGFVQKHQACLSSGAGIKRLLCVGQGLRKMRVQWRERHRTIRASFCRELSERIKHYGLVAAAGEQLRNLAQSVAALVRLFVAERRRNQSHQRTQTLQRFPTFVHTFRLHFRRSQFLQRRVELLSRNAAEALFNRLIDLEPVRHTREAPSSFSWN